MSGTILYCLHLQPYVQVIIEDTGLGIRQAKDRFIGSVVV